MPSTLAKLRVPVNPKGPVSIPENQILNIPSEVFAFKNGHVVRSHVLVFQVQCTTLKESSGSTAGEASPSELFT